MTFPNFSWLYPIDNKFIYFQFEHKYQSLTISCFYTQLDFILYFQYVFSELLLEQIEKRRQWMEEENVDGIVLTGGCALVSTEEPLFYGQQVSKINKIIKCPTNWKVIYNF